MTIRVSFVMTQGEDDLAEEQAKAKRAATKALEEQAKQARDSSVQEPESPEYVQMKPQAAIPKQVDGLMTHGCLAIFEMIENNLFSAELMGLEPSLHVHVLYQDNLPTPINKYWEDYVLKWKSGEPLLLQAGDIPQTPPSWWGTCSDQLTRTCSAAVPDGMMTTSYESLFHFVIFCLFCWITLP